MSGDLLRAGPLDGFQIALAEPGDVIECPDTGLRETMAENAVIVHRRRGVMFMTVATRDLVVAAIERENASTPDVLDLRARHIPDPPWVVQRRADQREREARQAAANASGQAALDAAAARRARRNAKRARPAPRTTPAGAA